MNVSKLIGSMLLTAALASSCSSVSKKSLANTSAINHLSNLSGAARCKAIAGLTSEFFELEIRETSYVASPQELDVQQNRLSPAQVATFTPYCKITG
ncbi:hypothetical protein [Aliiglaciecola sp. NS0011-25]|uniref:hypothetical protein n=1 Tax=Aliiglaciecola sp. NS0011-25 TaxID=3127654 RepID=UPI00310A9A21